MNRIQAALVLVACLFVGHRVIGHDFVLHDDPHEIYLNPLLNPLTAESWKQI
jgi:hypothetical protein